MIRKSLAVCMLSVLVFSCKKEASETTVSKTENDSIAKTEVKEDLHKPIDTVYSEKNKTEDYMAALGFYKSKAEKEIAAATPEQNNKIYEDYVQVRSKYIEGLSRLHTDILDKYVNYYDSGTESYKFPENIKKLSVEFKKAGLEFREVGEGMTEISSVPDYYYSLFKNKVTPDYNAYIAQNAVEAEDNYAADAGLIISWEELGNRLIFWEKFINKYPKSPLLKIVKKDYNNYLYDYLYGMDNTPTYESSDGKLYEENRKEFNRIINTYPNSYTAKRAKELLSLFESQMPVDQIREKMNVESNY
ncbi:hypothetical protein CLU96_3016 [Chryseobacterium sp. 52]|uniref:hypothetical protein n=1 Tax=Chryseobacterium sp. 52 TaxID=2035213 RepID=UPI000C62A90B|nr:hypothetical protein [Chryseobacterium sp. 52]PIF45999.1 hypothetical protein CLU96_3016 [Chryseobacterium sp. 52]